MTPQTVTNRFLYLKWDDLFYKEKPFQILIEVPPEARDQRKQNIEFEEGDWEVVHDVRAQERGPTLDEEGFTYIERLSILSPAQFKDKRSIETLYIPECESLLKAYLDNVQEVAIYDWRIRHSQNSHRQGSIVDLNDPLTPMGPATHIHVDQSPDSVVQRIQTLFPERKDSLLRGRVRLVNIWRPINGPVMDWPLAVSDGRTIKESCLVPTARVRRRFTGDTMFLLKNEGIKWFYMSGQCDSEVLLFKSFDSDESVTRWAAHGSFPLLGSSNTALPRESIEVRALVFSHGE